MGRVVKVQQIPQSEKNDSFDAETILATFCYYYPQYTFKQAKKLPYKRVKLMLDIALRQRNIFLMNLTRIVAAPHTKDMELVNTLLREFTELLDD